MWRWGNSGLTDGKSDAIYEINPLGIFVYIPVDAESTEVLKIGEKIRN